MTRTITVRGRDYTVVDEPRLTGEIAPHLYDESEDFAGVVTEMAGVTLVLYAPEWWTTDDHRSAVRQIETGGECGLCGEPCEACSPGGSGDIDRCTCPCS